MAEFYALFRSVLDAQSAAALDHHVAGRATVEGLQASLAAAGFTILHTNREQASLRFADGAAPLRHSFIRLGFLPAWQEIVPPAHRADVFARLQAALDAEASAKGSLDLTVPLAYVEARA